MELLKKLDDAGFSLPAAIQAERRGCIAPAAADVQVGDEAAAVNLHAAAVAATVVVAAVPPCSHR